MVCAIIICRSTSSRLPNKHLLKFGNKNLLEIIINQLKNLKIISNIVISTGRKNKNFHYEKYQKEYMNVPKRLIKNLPFLSLAIVP